MPHPEQKQKYKISLLIIPDAQGKLTTKLVHENTPIEEFDKYLNKQKIKTKLRKYITWFDILETKILRDKTEQSNAGLWQELMECVRQMHRDCVYNYLDDHVYEIAKRITHRDLFS